MPSKPLSQAGADLGLGDMLTQQRQDETEEERKKRMLGMSAMNSPAAQSLMLGGFGQIGVPGAPRR